MKKNTKSSITLPRAENELVTSLVKTLGAKSKVEVIRRGLYLLKTQSDRDTIRAAYALASKKTEKATLSELRELDHLADEGLE